MSSALPPLDRIFARVAAATGAVFFAVGAPTALLSAVPPVSTSRLVPALVGYGAWIACFARVALTRGLTTPLMIANVGVTVLVVASAGYLVPLERVDDSSSWTAGVAMLCVATLPMAWRARAAVPAGLLVVAAFLASFPLAGLPTAGADNAAVLVVQLLSAVAVLGVIRRANAAADTAIAAAAQARAAAAVAQARRRDVGAQLRLLHDTALTTLTLVGTGAIGRSQTLAARARADVGALQAIAAGGIEVPDHLVSLDDVLAAAVREAPPGLDIRLSLQACTVPAPVAEAFAGGVGEALRNVDRHAGVRAAAVGLVMGGGRIRVQVRDEGRGFDPAAAKAHRYGVRGSIVGRLAEVGGRATVESAPGAGTTWTLVWPS